MRLAPLAGGKAICNGATPTLVGEGYSTAELLENPKPLAARLLQRPFLFGQRQSRTEGAKLLRYDLQTYLPTSSRR